MNRGSELTIGFALVMAMGCGVSNAAEQTDTYPRMAPIDQYLMEKTAEIQLARSAAPNSISRKNLLSAVDFPCAQTTIR